LPRTNCLGAPLIASHRTICLALIASERLRSPLIAGATKLIQYAHWERDRFKTDARPPPPLHLDLSDNCIIEPQGLLDELKGKRIKLSTSAEDADATVILPNFTEQRSAPPPPPDNGGKGKRPAGGGGVGGGGGGGGGGRGGGGGGGRYGGGGGNSAGLDVERCVQVPACEALSDLCVEQCAVVGPPVPIPDAAVPGAGDEPRDVGRVPPDPPDATPLDLDAGALPSDDGESRAASPERGGCATTPSPPVALAVGLLVFVLRRRRP
jgi:hypothetical protein